MILPGSKALIFLLLRRREVVPHVFTKNLTLIILLLFKFFLEKLKRRAQEEEGTRRQEEEEKRQKRHDVKSNLCTRHKTELLKNQWTLGLFQQFLFSNAFSIYSKPVFVKFVV